MENIDLFNAKLTQNWSLEQKQHFVKVFYHSRGHFRDFLFFLGNFAPNKKIKLIFLENIREEFGDDNLSHEQLYLDYAKTLGVDLKPEIIEEKYYTSEMRQFNKAHIKWMLSKDWESQFAAFSAYERLDSTDYTKLLSLSEKEHKFFTIHRVAKHFEKTYRELTILWNKNPAKVEEAFAFVADVQLKMWKDLSNTIFNFIP